MRGSAVSFDDCTTWSISAEKTRSPLGDFSGQAILSLSIYNDKVAEGDFAWEDGCTSSYTNWDAGPPQEPNNDPNFGGEDCTIKWNDGTTWNDVPCDFTYPCYCQDVKGGGY